MTITMFIPGPPRTKGSFRAVRNRRTGKSLLINDNRKTKGWSHEIAWAYRLMKGRMLRPPCSIAVEILRVELPEQKPDVDKILRAVLDALTGIAYADDSHVISAQVCKLVTTYEPGTRITIEGEPA